MKTDTGSFWQSEEGQTKTGRQIFEIKMYDVSDYAKTNVELIRQNASAEEKQINTRNVRHREKMRLYRKWRDNRYVSE